MKTKYCMIWLDEDNEPILSFNCYFKEDKPKNDVGEDNTPYLDPSCAVSIMDADITCTAEVFESRCEIAKY